MWRRRLLGAKVRRIEALPLPMGLRKLWKLTNRLEKTHAPETCLEESAAPVEYSTSEVIYPPIRAVLNRHEPRLFLSLLDWDFSLRLLDRLGANEESKMELLIGPI